jgi:hypothetical protein
VVFIFVSRTTYIVLLVLLHSSLHAYQVAGHLLPNLGPSRKALEIEFDISGCGEWACGESISISAESFASRFSCRSTPKTSVCTVQTIQKLVDVSATASMGSPSFGGEQMYLSDSILM